LSSFILLFFRREDTVLLTNCPLPPFRKKQIVSHSNRAFEINQQWKLVLCKLHLTVIPISFIVVLGVEMNSR
jgi:hypothetical protein